jgi:hypothetical protein
MTTMPGPPDGREPEACAQLDPGLFFPISSAGSAREYTAMAQGDLRRGRRPEPLRVVSLLAGGLAGQGRAGHERKAAGVMLWSRAGIR